MKGLIQRVQHASVSVDGELVGEIGRGLLLFLAVEPADTEASMERLLSKVIGYRVFPDAQGRMNHSLSQEQGELLVVSQFTLAADTRKGLRPSFTSSAPPELAQHLYNRFVAEAQLRVSRGELGKVAQGRFAADMAVSLVNDGPVTFWLSAH